ncbi:HAMP domain-containing sensor histidine kinase [Rhodoferax sp. PAMC 29310]|uniref:sensor histidine kinase n=1 Tax=Rhodoferax sp. PAMC 29310 TaxID=2822760 RepID=UPI001B33D194|nr:HAMP domain-containing sensor histidine kinase [Rhodoferax sp. PAMC 29310]
MSERVWHWPWASFSPLAFTTSLWEKMVGLGVAELAAALLLLLPGALLARHTKRVTLAENFLLLGVSVVFGALLVFGAIEGTGIYWVFILPFLVFFIKDQRSGWLGSLWFLGLSSVYLIVLAPHFTFNYPHTPVVVSRFLIAFFLYTLIAAGFNRHRVRFEGSLVEARMQAEATAQAKSRFLAAASHDLRQPAHALGLFVGRLTQVSHDAQTRQIVNGVDQAVRGLQQMLDDFFDYTRLDAHAEPPLTHHFAIGNVLDRLEIGFGSRALEKGLRFRIRPSPYWVNSDPVVLHRVLLNLVSNALQYTADGFILVACRVDSLRSTLRIEVWDSGIGIAPQYHEAIFAEFFLNPERDRRKGIGLGLSIV